MEVQESTRKYKEVHGSTHGWKSGVQKIDLWFAPQYCQYVLYSMCRLLTLGR